MFKKIILTSVISLASLQVLAGTIDSSKAECNDIQSYFAKKESELPYQFTDHGVITDASAKFMGEICLVEMDIEYSEDALIDHFLTNAKGITVNDILEYVNSNHVNNVMRKNFREQAKGDYANHPHPESMIFQYNIAYDGERINDKLISFNIDF